MRDEEQPLFDDYRGSARSDSRKTVIGILSALVVILLVGLGVMTYLWQHKDAPIVPPASSNATTFFPHTTNTAPMPSPTSTPTPEPTTPQGVPVAWNAIASSVLGAMDFTASPCDDFYRYSCGGWLDNNTIPADRGTWARSFGPLAKSIEDIEMEIAGAGWPLIGTFYSACLNESALDANGVRPIADMLTAVSNVNDVTSLTSVLLEFYAVGVSALFEFGAAPDDFAPSVVNAVFDQGGVSVSAQYYNSTDPYAVSVMTALLTLSETIFTLLPAPFNSTPSASANAVVEFEAQLAAISLTPSERRNPATVYNKLSLAELSNLTTSIDFGAFMSGLDVSPAWNTSNLNVASMPFFESFDSVVGPLLHSNVTLLQHVLAFKYVVSYAGVLSKPFRDALVKFGAALSGVTAQPSREVQCVRALDSGPLGMAVGHVFVSEEFSAESKADASSLVHQVEDAFGKRLNDVTWLDNATRAAAETKLSEVTNQIGYPAKWESFAGLTLSDDHFTNVQALANFAASREVAKLGAPADRNAWDMLPQQVNAYYDPTKNQMVFPAGILGGTFYNHLAPGALNYGGIGGVIGHELSHGFDDQGRQFNGEGARIPWWPPAVVAAFENATKCVVEVYESFPPLPDANGTHVNGELTLGENLADMGGVANSYRAYVARLAADAEFAAQEALVPKVFNNLTSNQLYFVAWAQNWCTLQRPQSLQQQLKNDPHSPGPIRVLGPISQAPLTMFAEAFMCPTGSKYAPAERCTVW